ncbi:MAG TPA: flavodoxin domain-containing protein [Gemmatimonadaceae bacterium]|nr:flavodoxin domain-containing protein [Gemmatimonadaceae bacterium]
MSSHILIVYGTTYGQTQKIAEHIRDRLSDEFGVTVVRGDAPMNPLTADHFDGVLVGGSILAGRHQRYIEEFVRRNVATLNAMPSALFSVSGSAGSEKPSGRADAQRCADRLLDDTQWRPQLVATIAGCIAYTKYAWPMRMVLKFISWRAGGSTDTSRDHEYTNWAQVDRFASDFGTIVRESASHPLPV